MTHVVGEANVSGPLGTVGTRRSLCGAHGPVQGVSEAVLVTQPDQHTRREWSVVDPRLSAFCRTTSKLARRGRAFKTEGKAGAETKHTPAKCMQGRVLWDALTL